MKRPVALLVYVFLTFLSAAGDTLTAAQLAFTHAAPAWSILATFAWACFSFFLGLGILRLQEAWRLVAVVLCWVVYALFAFMVVAWCIWPKSVEPPLVLSMIVMITLNTWFYLTFRRDDVRALFQQHGASRIR